MSARTLALLWILAAPTFVQGQSCPAVTSGFHLPGTDGFVHCAIVHDDGTGPALYIGGQFRTVGTAEAHGIARFDGTHWTGVGGGCELNLSTTGTVLALASIQGRLWVGGDFISAGGVPVQNLASWDGSTWRTEHGPEVGNVQTIAEYQGRVHVGGAFNTIGGNAVSNLARLDPNGWSRVGASAPPDGWVRSLTVWNTLGSSTLYAGGDFQSIDGMASEHLARWDGTAWASFGGVNYLGTFSLGPMVKSLRVFDDGTGPALYVGGYFEVLHTGTATITTTGFARYDGTTWTAFGAGLDGTGPNTRPSVSSMETHDDGSGPALYLCGRFDGAGGTPSPYVIRYTGAGFSPIATSTDAPVDALASFQGDLIAGGRFDRAGGTRALHVARLHQGAWSAMSDGMGFKVPCSAMAVFDEGAGPRLFAAPRGSSEQPVQRWEGQAWSQLGAGFPPNCGVSALLPHDDGAGTALFVAGNLPDVLSGTIGHRVLRWDGVSFAAVGGEADNQILGFASYAAGLGGGPSLYACGSFTSIGGQSAAGVARWSGSSWSALGSGLVGSCLALQVFDDGSGPALYALGDLLSAGGSLVHDVARWNGTAWSDVGGGIDDPSGYALAATVFDDGSGPALYVAGSFHHIGGSPAESIARWDGSTWSSLGGGLTGTNVRVFALASLATPEGPRLVATGHFDFAGTVAARNLASWDGVRWSAIGSGLTPRWTGAPIVGLSLGVFDGGSGSGPDLFVSGWFTAADGVPANDIARLENCPGTVVCAGDGSAAACPCGNFSAAGSGAGCANSLGVGAILSARGRASLAADTLVLTTTQTSGPIGLYLQGTAAFGGGTGIVFGDGLRCVSGNVTRLATVPSQQGASTLPNASQPTRLSLLGSIVVAGTRAYQTWYRNAATFCMPSTFNLTNGLLVTWTP